ncbi:MAG: hypothetical protein KAF27_05420 [Porphyrobacter sp.]|nr:hypothetical protein [Porphyrobacter sp.]
MFAACRTSIALGAAMLALAGCATPDPRAGERTVFSNPYGTDRTGIGPQCDVDLGRDSTCLGAPLIFDGGRYVKLGNGSIERLTRQQRRILRERAELLEVLRDQPPASPPPPSAPPIAETEERP